MLALCNFQRLKELVKVSKHYKFGDLVLKTVTLVKLLKADIFIENVSEFCV